MNANDYKVVNLGQLKTVFNFDLRSDSDTNSLPDWWEMHYFGHLGNDASSSPDGNGYTLAQDYANGSNPTNYYSQGGTTITPTILVVGGDNQTSLTGTFAPQALSVQVVDGSGNPLANAPVTFNVVSGGGQIATDPLGTTTTLLPITTDAFGFAQVYFQQPSTPGVTSSISATTGGQSVVFTELSASPAATPTMTPGPGIYTSAQTVMVSSTSTDAIIYYTTDGTDPTVSSSFVASGDTIQVARNQMLKVMAVATGFVPSSIVGGRYWIETNDLAAGDSFTMLRKGDGSVWTWGDNGRGQQGDNQAENPAAIPQQVPTLPGVSMVAAARDHALAVDTSGEVWAWGANDQSQGGDGGTSDQLVPTLVGSLTNIQAVYAGPAQSFAIDDLGNLYAWGQNDQGQLGDGTTTSQSGPEPIALTLPSGVVPVKIASGITHSLLLASDGTLWATGNNGAGELGDGTTANSSTFEQVPAMSNVQDVAVGANHSLALKADGSVWAWGTDWDGQLGDGNIGGGTGTPQQVALPELAVAVFAVDTKSYVILADGTVRGFGSNSQGQMGIGSDLVDKSTPVEPSGVSNVSLLAAGSYHTVVCTQTGALYGWGDNSSMRLTQEFNNFNRNTEVHDDAWQGFVQVVSAENTTLGLGNDGTVWASGDGYYGVVGQGSWTGTERSTQVPGLSHIAKLVGGVQFAAALGTDGSLWTWGNNYHGQLGQGNTDTQNAPVQVTGLSGVTDAALGYEHTLIIKSDGTVWAAGDDANGELGDGGTSDQSTPIRVTSLSGTVTPVAAAAGYHTSFVLDSTGTVWAWGQNDGGQLGLGTMGDVGTPVPISGLPAMIAISARANNGIGIDESGNVWSWGGLGNGDGTPLEQSGPTNVVAVATSGGHQVAVQSDGTLWGWGFGYSGQLGNGSYPYNWSPVEFLDTQGNPVKGVTGVSASDATTYILKEDGSISGFGGCSLGQLASGVGVQDYLPRPLFGITQSGTVPAVTLDSTAFGHPIALGTTVFFNATATASSGTIDHIDFYLEGVPIGTWYGGSATFYYTPASCGDYTFEAIAYDSAGLAQISSPLTINVSYDIDSNSLPDWWELRTLGYIGNDPSDPSPTGDGNTLLQDYQFQVGSTAGGGGYSVPPPSISTEQNGDGTVSVVLGSTSSATIYYTTDGSTPTTSSNVYTGPLSLSGATTLKYAAYSGSTQISSTRSTLVGPAPTAATGFTGLAGDFSVKLNWTNTSSNVTSTLLQQKVGGNWVTIASLSPSATSTTVTGLAARQTSFRLLQMNQFGLSTIALGSDVTPDYVAPRYAIIDLGANMNPQKITNSGYVLMRDNSGNYYRWNGSATQLTVPSGYTLSEVTDIGENGTVVGDGLDSSGNAVLLSWGPTSSVATSSASAQTGGSVFGLLLSPSGSVSMTNDIWSIQAGGVHATDGYYNQVEIGDGISHAGLASGFGDGAYTAPPIPDYMSGTTVIPITVNNLGHAPSVKTVYAVTSLTGSIPLSEAGFYVSDYAAYGVYADSSNVYFPVHISVGTTTYIMSANGNASGAELPFKPTAINNADCILGQPDGSGTFTYADTVGGTQTALPAGFTAISLNAALSGTLPAYQILGTDNNGALQLLEMSSSGTFPANAEPLTNYIPQDSPWIGFSAANVAPGIGMRRLNNDNDVIVTTGTLSSVTNNGHVNLDGFPMTLGAGPTSSTPPLTETTTEQHATMLIDMQIDKVWSDQNGGLGDMSNNNYFTNIDSKHTGHEGAPFMMMGFRNDGLGHVGAHLKISNSSSLINKLLVRLAIQPYGPGTPITPVGDGTFDANTGKATLTYNGANDFLTDWFVVAGFDLDGNGHLDANEISTQSTYRIRAIQQLDYTTRKLFLLTGAKSAGIFLFVAGNFLNTFCTGDAPAGAIDSTTTIATNDPALNFNVGVLFEPSGEGDIHRYEFPVTSDVSDEVANSNTFVKSEIPFRLIQHDAEVLAHNFTGETTHNFTWTETRVIQFDFLNGYNDTDLQQSFGRAQADYSITATVRASDKKLVSIRYWGAIYDLYDFDWLPHAADQAGLSVQAGYNSLGNGGHVFKTQVDFDKTRTDINFTF